VEPAPPESGEGHSDVRRGQRMKMLMLRCRHMMHAADDGVYQRLSALHATVQDNTIMHVLTFMFTFLPLQDEFRSKYRRLITNTQKSESTGTFLYYDKQKHQNHLNW